MMFSLDLSACGMEILRQFVSRTMSRAISPFERIFALYGACTVPLEREAYFIYLVVCS